MEEKQHRGEGIVKNNKGFTLMELILVIALGSLVMLSAMLLYEKGRDAAMADATVKKMHAILSGLSELRMYKGKLTAGAAWPADTNNYVNSDIRTEYGYNCNAGTLTITTQTFDDANQTDRILTKLTDQKLCVAGSAVTAGNKIDCIVSGFTGSAGC